MANISNITYCPGIVLVTLPKVPADSRIVGEILTTLAENGINVDMISQTAPQGGEIALAFSISMDAMERLLPCVSGLKPKYPALTCDVRTGMTKFNFYDQDMVNTPGVAAKVFSLLAKGSISVEMITTSTVDISILIPAHDEDAAGTLLKSAFGVEAEEVPFA